MSERQIRQCSAVTCKEREKGAIFMCSYHWNLLPSRVRSAVWSAYRNWKNGGLELGHVLALKRAQLHLARYERRDEYEVSLTAAIARLEAKIASRQEGAQHASKVE